MKLATLQDGSRDGQLVVVSRDLACAHYATGIANRLQQVLDDWGFVAPQLQELADRLDAGRARHAFAFDPARCLAPLPRAFERVGVRAWPSPDDAAGAGPADAAMPAMEARAGELLGPCHPIELASEASGVDFGAGLAVVTGDVRRGATSARALDGVRLVLLVNDIRLQHVPAAGRGRGVATLQGHTATAFGSVAVTPDELGGAWRDGRAHLALQTTWNGHKAGLCDTGEDMRFHFGELVAHLATTRPVRAGTVVGGGTVGHDGVVREDGRPTTGFMRLGDTVRIEAKGPDGRSVFGTIEQEVVVAVDAAVDPARAGSPGA